MTRGTTRRTSLAQPARIWALRGGLALAAIVCGYASVTQSLGYAVHKRAPERGYALAPSDGRVAALLAERLSTAKASVADRQRAGRLAHQALLAEPLAVPAVTVLALNAALAGNDAGARRLFARSNTLSRRDLPTRLWLIEDAVQRNDIQGAVDNYDIALRTSRTVSDRLFPILASAIGDPAIAAILAPTLAKRPPWGESFILYLSNSSPDPTASASFFRRLTARGVPLPEGSQASVVNALVVASAFDNAWTFYRTLRPGVDRRQSRDPDFAAQLEVPTTFDWTPRMTDAGITSSIQRTAATGVFDFAAPSTVGGIVLEQLQLLPPGRYRISGRSIGIEQSAGSRPYWLLVCVDGRELGRVDVPNSAQNEGRFDGVFNVQGPCPAQMLRLVVRPSDLVSGVSGQIDRVALRPL